MKRTIVIPAIMALSTAGSVLAGAVASMTTTAAPAAAAVVASGAHPDYVYDD